MTHEPDHLPGEPVYRPSLAVFIAALVVWTFLLSLVLLVAPARSEVVVNGMGGGSLGWGQRQANRLYQRALDDGGPVRLEGRYSSAGTMLLNVVERVPGSCVAEDSIFGFHQPQSPIALLTVCAPLSPEVFQRAGRLMTGHYTPSLSAWVWENVLDRYQCRFHNLRGHQLEHFGYSVCEGEDR